MKLNNFYTMLKKMVIFWSVLPLFIISSECENDLRARTIFVPRSLTCNGVLEFAFNNYHIYHSMLNYYEDFSLGFYVTPFYMGTTNNDFLTNYFLSSSLSSVAVKQDGTGNVGSQWIGLTGTDEISFSSQLCMRPTRSVGGLHSLLYINLDPLCYNLWASVSFVFARVQQSLNLQESNLVIEGTGNFKTATEAFNNSDWNFAKLNCESMHKSGVDDVQLKLGYNWYWDDENHFGLYTLATIPTGKKENIEYLFEPIIGSRHASFGVGLFADFGGWINDDHFLNWMTTCDYRYVFSAKEMRTFNLCNNGQWSRYLQIVAAGNSTEPFPGVNCLTKEVSVCPNSQFQLWSAIHYEFCNWGIEVGYNYWWRNHETIHDIACQNNIAIFDITANPIENAVSASQATICQAATGPNKVPSDTVFTPITAQNFNLDSAAHPRASTHTVYGALCYTGEVDNCPGTIGVGGSYEFARDSAAFEQWGIWLKLGIGF
ncbi:hypothetical protein HRU45_01285 [Candidatus Dependentiae bacterium]|nr:hypothetical protein [Candidatus Dependentiae bacterium]